MNNDAWFGILFLVGLIALVGCETQISKSFSHTMEDGSSVTISIEYKPKSLIEGDKKVGVYYYIVRFQPSSSFTPNDSIIPNYHGDIYMSFYDEKGHLFLVRSSSLRGDKKINGVYESKGGFSEDTITLERFRDLDYMEASYKR